MSRCEMLQTVSGVYVNRGEKYPPKYQPLATRCLGDLHELLEASASFGAQMRGGVSSSASTDDGGIEPIVRDAKLGVDADTVKEVFQKWLTESGACTRYFRKEAPTFSAGAASHLTRQHAAKSGFAAKQQEEDLKLAAKGDLFDDNFALGSAAEDQTDKKLAKSKGAAMKNANNKAAVSKMEESAMKSTEKAGVKKEVKKSNDKAKTASTKTKATSMAKKAGAGAPKGGKSMAMAMKMAKRVTSTADSLPSSGMMSTLQKEPDAHGAGAGPSSSSAGMSFLFFNDAEAGDSTSSLAKKSRASKVAKTSTAKMASGTKMGKSASTPRKSAATAEEKEAAPAIASGQQPDHFCNDCGQHYRSRNTLRRHDCTAREPEENYRSTMFSGESTGNLMERAKAAALGREFGHEENTNNGTPHYVLANQKTSVRGSHHSHGHFYPVYGKDRTAGSKVIPIDEYPMSSDEDDKQMLQFVRDTSKANVEAGDKKSSSSMKKAPASKSSKAGSNKVVPALAGLEEASADAKAAAKAEKEAAAAAAREKLPEFWKKLGASKEDLHPELKSHSHAYTINVVSPHKAVTQLRSPATGPEKKWAKLVKSAVAASSDEGDVDSKIGDSRATHSEDTKSKKAEFSPTKKEVKIDAQSPELGKNKKFAKAAAKRPNVHGTPLLSATSTEKNEKKASAAPAAAASAKKPSSPRRDAAAYINISEKQRKSELDAFLGEMLGKDLDVGQIGKRVPKSQLSAKTSSTMKIMRKSTSSADVADKDNKSDAASSSTSKMAMKNAGALKHHTDMSEAHHDAGSILEEEKLFFMFSNLLTEDIREAHYMGVFCLLKHFASYWTLEGLERFFVLFRQKNSFLARIAGLEDANTAAFCRHELCGIGLPKRGLTSYVPKSTAALLPPMPTTVQLAGASPLMKSRDAGKDGDRVTAGLESYVQELMRGWGMDASGGKSGESSSKKESTTADVAASTRSSAHKRQSLTAAELEGKYFTVTVFVHSLSFVAQWLIAPAMLKYESAQRKLLKDDKLEPVVSSVTSSSSPVKHPSVAPLPPMSASAHPPTAAVGSTKPSPALPLPVADSPRQTPLTPGRRALTVTASVHELSHVPGYQGLSETVQDSVLPSSVAINPILKHHLSPKLREVREEVNHAVASGSGPVTKVRFQVDSPRAGARQQGQGAGSPAKRRRTDDSADDEVRDQSWQFGLGHADRWAKKHSSLDSPNPWLKDVAVKISSTEMKGGKQAAKGKGKSYSNGSPSLGPMMPPSAMNKGQGKQAMPTAGQSPFSPSNRAVYSSPTGSSAVPGGLLFQALSSSVPGAQSVKPPAPSSAGTPSSVVPANTAPTAYIVPVEQFVRTPQQWRQWYFVQLPNLAKLALAGSGRAPYKAYFEHLARLDRVLFASGAHNIKIKGRGGLGVAPGMSPSRTPLGGPSASDALRILENAYPTDQWILRDAGHPLICALCILQCPWIGSEARLLAYVKFALIKYPTLQLPEPILEAARSGHALSPTEEPEEDERSAKRARTEPRLSSADSPSTRECTPQELATLRAAITLALSLHVKRNEAAAGAVRRFLSEESQITASVRVDFSHASMVDADWQALRSQIEVVEP
ncbi:unnamed protein product [Amoebophrya sp. A25]|nr:unnamed protein product [Amoebophrya sp. A25]|eukprot:GSA25T00017454001.1